MPESFSHANGDGAASDSTNLDPAVVDVVDPRAWATVAVVAATGGLVSLDTMVNIAFPAITASFGIEVSEIQWLVTTYVLTFVSLFLAAGRLSDVSGIVALSSSAWC